MTRHLPPALLAACGKSGPSSSSAASGSTGTSAAGDTATAATTAQTGSGAAAAAAGDVVALLDRAGSCAVVPELTEGPYYIDVEKVRGDIREDRPGTPLTVAIRVRSGHHQGQRRHLRQGQPAHADEDRRRLPGGRQPRRQDRVTSVDRDEAGGSMERSGG
jgi:hypothetical protein